MEKRITILFSIFMILICCVIFNLYFLSQVNWLQEAAINQHSYRLKVAKFRGNIYDCNMKPLINKSKSMIAAVLPTIKSVEKIKKTFTSKQMNEVLPLLSKALPFTTKVNEYIAEDSGIKTFFLPQRYEEKQISPHIIGYINSEDGLCGIEKSYNDFLSDCSGEISIKYKVDARGHILGDDKDVEVRDTSYLQKRGVVLTIDEQIQQLLQNAMEKQIKKGAAIIIKVPSAEIKACVSLPDFSPEKLGDVINSNNSPLLNRVFSSYNLGSIFKLVTAAAALENNISEETKFDCKGKLEVDSTQFNCFTGEHGEVNMESAMQHSCNGYFIRLLEMISLDKMLDISSRLGFGQSCEIAPGMFSDKGNLPKLSDLKSRADIASFSFGQGLLTATPLQVAELTNVIASEGNFVKPRLVEGFVNESLNYIEKFEKIESQRVISKETARILKKFMKTSLEKGTSSVARPVNVSAAAKTSTAQTGRKIGDEELVQAWFSGIFPYENPRYAFVIFSEDVKKGGGHECGPIFTQVVDKMIEMGM
ncbi:MAG: penicillin-binding protein 2 [Oscillospiraceae bacterium]|nr:penicillin-binding protein 2 [Oscillospiraceae bacterium]